VDQKRKHSEIQASSIQTVSILLLRLAIPKHVISSFPSIHTSPHLLLILGKHLRVSSETLNRARVSKNSKSSIKTRERERSSKPNLKSTKDEKEKTKNKEKK
jgi:hypothetical protein